MDAQLPPQQQLVPFFVLAVLLLEVAALAMEWVKAAARVVEQVAAGAVGQEEEEENTAGLQLGRG